MVSVLAIDLFVQQLCLKKITCKWCWSRRNPQCILWRTFSKFIQTLKFNVSSHWSYQQPPKDTNKQMWYRNLGLPARAIVNLTLFRLTPEWRVLNDHVPEYKRQFRTISRRNWSLLFRGTALRVGRTRVRLPMVSLRFFIDIILPAAYVLGVDSVSDRNEHQEYLLGIKPAGA